MPLPESLNPDQLAKIALVEAWKAMSAAAPSLTVPAVGAVVSGALKPGKLWPVIDPTKELPNNAGGKRRLLPPARRLRDRDR